MSRRTLLPGLGRLAAQWLVDGGLLAMYSGHSWLPEVLQRLGEHLEWGWMGTSAWSGKANLIRPRQVVSNSKPVLIYTKGPWKELRRWCDTSIVNCQEKGWHAWQQPLEDVEHWVRQFSKPGDLIVDPCGGGFTTAVACYRPGRRFIGCDCDEEGVLRGRQRLVEERARREKLLKDLGEWIEDSKDLKSRRPSANYLPYVRQVWQAFSGSGPNQMPYYLRLLPQHYQALYRSLGATG